MRNTILLTVAALALVSGVAGAPHFWVLSAGGKVLESQDTLPLEDGDKSYDRGKFQAFIERWRDRAARTEPK